MGVSRREEQPMAKTEPRRASSPGGNAGRSLLTNIHARSPGRTRLSSRGGWCGRWLDECEYLFDYLPTVHHHFRVLRTRMR